MMGGLRRIARLLRKWGPPIALGGWAVHFYTTVTGYAIPAFGPVESHLTAYRGEVLAQLGLGAALLLVWAASWVVDRRRPSSRSPQTLGTKSQEKRRALQ